MVQIAGKYKNEKNENLVEYFKEVGLPDEFATKAATPNLILDVIVEGNKVSLNSSSGVNISFVLDQEYQETLPTASVVKSIAKLEGNSITITSKQEGGQTGTRVYQFTDDGIIATFAQNKVVAKRYYKRI